ncbi:MAG: ImmA/IrrE family metallo-endopeptidase [Candidatus Marinimicrobia bacterium]|nr:ImmA/IrrE family metallo-endopeptidase [Candidatus Neomarinimicrobiota bacterium]
MTSTVEKGSIFEEKIYSLFSDQIKRGRFMFFPENAKIYKQKGYYSKDRESDIVFDVSIEVFLPNEDEFTLLLLIECKDYDSSIPVSDVEEFFTKTQQVSAGNVKGIFVSTNSFQSGSIKFAKSKGFGLLRYTSESEYKWILNRSPSSLVSWSYAQNNWSDAWRGLSEEHFQSRYYDFHGYSNGRCSNSTILFFQNLIMTNSSSEFRERIQPIVVPIESHTCTVPFLQMNEIEQKCNNLHQRIGYDGGVVDLQAVYEPEIESKSLKIIFPEKSYTSHLGKIKFLPTSITIYNDPKSRKRRKFTLAHELGHYFLEHSNYMAGEYCDENDFTSTPSGGIKEISRMEWQANHFASCLLLPQKQTLKCFWELALKHNLKDRGFGLLYVDNQPGNVSRFMSITGKLVDKFDVSRAAIQFRLEQLGLLNDDRDKKQDKGQTTP